MKIISKARDYWHYLQGVYGIDPLLTYDNREAKAIDVKSNSEITVYFCGKKFFFFKMKDGTWGHNPHDILAKYNEDNNFFGSGYKSYFIWKKSYHTKINCLEAAERKYEKINFVVDSELKNIQYRQPILIKTSWSDEFFSPKQLEVINFHKLFTAHEVYTKVSEFLGWLKDHPAIPDNQTDKEKVVSHGFDAKKSFRPTMK